LEQQTATAEVLQVISSSPGDLQPVFATMLEKAVRICDATFGNIYRWDGDALQLVATHNTPLAYAEHRKTSPFRADQNNSVARMIRSKKVVHLLDAAANETYTTLRDPTVVAAVELGGIRSALIVPMLKEDELVGAFIVSRQEVRPFTEKQIALITNFAAQAVIAIENARLLNELRESLQQQTATSDVLQVISRFPGDLQPVFEAVLANATQICDAKFGLLWLTDRGGFRCVALHNVPPAFADHYHSQAVIHPAAGTGLRRLADTRNVAQVPDMTKIRPYIERDPFVVTSVELGGYRSVVNVPMLKDKELIGAISIYRQEVHPFSDKQIELVKNFAAQAVIAIENARLLNELRQRTEEVEKLNQHLEQRVTDQVGEIERMGRLRRFLPPQVADLIVASGTEKQLESHRQEITALFCDLRGFTGFSEASAPEDVMILLRDYHAAIGEIIIKYSGTLERYAGDGVMVCSTTLSR
jgi:GAF domain-containing protein